MGKRTGHRFQSTISRFSQASVAFQIRESCIASIVEGMIRLDEEGRDFSCDYQASKHKVACLVCSSRRVCRVRTVLLDSVISFLRVSLLSFRECISWLRLACFSAALLWLLASSFALYNEVCRTLSSSLNLTARHNCPHVMESPAWLTVW